MSYLAILVLIAFTAVCLEWKFRVHLYHSRRQAIITTFVLFAVGTLWDLYALSRGHWQFPGPGLVGVHIGPLPLEEYLFMFIVPFWIITVYRVIARQVR